MKKKNLLVFNFFATTTPLPISTDCLNVKQVNASFLQRENQDDRITVTCTRLWNADIFCRSQPIFSNTPLFHQMKSFKEVSETHIMLCCFNVHVFCLFARFVFACYFNNCLCACVHIYRSMDGLLRDRYVRHRLH